MSVEDNFSYRESLSRLRAVLQRGLETIRLVGTNLGMDVDHIVHLARTFTEQVIYNCCFSLHRTKYLAVVPAIFSS